ncbi:hypothetical protein [Nocardia sp. NPDC127526]|uniref:hypothetical protein n=1 Tax=Nocardia sp. NPDC127526 TaxID=3345393 RepID=UPI00363FD956
MKPPVVARSVLALGQFGTGALVHEVVSARLIGHPGFDHVRWWLLAQLLVLSAAAGAAIASTAISSPVAAQAVWRSSLVLGAAGLAGIAMALTIAAQAGGSR